MNIDNIIKNYYHPGTPLYDIFMGHASCVTQKSLEIAHRVIHLNPDTAFIEEAAMLHDIGIFMTHSPAIHCMGDYPYICHGFLGRELLDALGRDLSRHALVCERHTGTGITADSIKNNALLFKNFPCRDMVPVTLEEEIICFADKFYSKKQEEAGIEKSVDKVAGEMFKLGKSYGERFLEWMNKFSE